jgi:Domain of unknown function (DUF4432)
LLYIGPGKGTKEDEVFTHGRKAGCRVTLDYTYRGMRVAFLENDALRVGVLVDKGGDVFELAYKPRDLDFMWQSPIPLRKPFVATSALPEGAFHDYYYGGWQEVLPSAGWAEEPYLGTYQGLHGEASLLPFDARVLEDEPEEVTLELKVRLYRTPLALTRRMSLRGDAPALFVEERLENESAGEFAVMWGHHPAFGPPFLDDSCVVSVPAAAVDVLQYHRNGLWEPGEDYAFPMVPNRRTDEKGDVTRVLPPETRSVDVIRFKSLSEGWYGLTSERLGVGIGLAWDANVFGNLWMWQVYGGHDDYPWYGRTYNVALEPFTSWPPAGVKNAVDNGTARVMQPGEVIETDLVAVVYEGSGVARIGRDGSVEA